MTRLVSAVALVALGLATISGCTVSVDGDDEVLARRAWTS